MFRRPRRSGINFIENQNDRNLTYFKRRSGLYKSAADLSTLTGAKIAIVLEAESGKKSAFGTPSANPIIDSFLSEHKPYIDEGETAKITHLQDDLFRLEKDKAVEEKRARESKNRLKAIEDTSGIDKLASSDVEDLGAEELSKLLPRLTRVREDINDEANSSKQQGVSGQSGPLLQPSSSSWHSQIKMPPRRLPWVSLQASSQHPPSSWAPLQHQSRSSLLRQTTPPSAQEPPSLPMLHHQQAHMMPPLPNEAHQYSYYFQQPQSPFYSSQPYPFPSEFHHLPMSMEHSPLLPQQGELPFNQMAPSDPNHGHTNLNKVAPPDQNHTYPHNIDFNLVVQPGQDHVYSHNFNFNLVAQTPDQANSHNFADDQPYDGYMWPPGSPNVLNLDPSLHALNAYLGLTDDYGDQADGGESSGDGA